MGIGSSKDIEKRETMVLLAKMGEWDKVWEILDKNPHFVNCIPEKRHGAPLNTHGTGKTAEQLTDNEEVKGVIFWKKQKLKQEYYECPTFVAISESNIIIRRYVCLTIEAHRGLLCPERFNPALLDLYTKMLEEMFLYIVYEDKWESVKEIVSRELYNCSRELALECNATNSKDAFFKHLITIYANENLQVYRKLYSELHYHKLNEEYNPEFCTFSTLLNAVLFFLQDLQSYTNVTYMGAKLSPEQIDRYSNGTEFAWLCIKSCTNTKNLVDISEGCIFIIDNSLLCKWSPKSIAFLEDKNKMKYLYPCGAQFRVTSVDKSKSKIHIFLKLISSVDPSPIRPLSDGTTNKTETSVAGNFENEIELAAKMGEWDQVWKLLGKDPYLINCIPAERSWGILHHACYWENECAVRRILSTPSCDPNLVTKDGLRAIEITEKSDLQALITNAVQQFEDKIFAEMQHADKPKIEKINSAIEEDDLTQIILLFDEDQHLVDVTSPVTGLAALHKAVLLGDVEVVTRILSYPASNPDVKTIEAPLNTYGVDKTAEQLTDSEEVKEVIGWKKQQLKQEYYECPTFVDINDSNILLMKYVCTSIEAHRGLLCSKKFNPQQFEAFPVLIENMFLYIQYSSMWKAAKVIVSRELYQHSRSLSLECNETTTEESFYKKLIKIYTNSSAYSSINSELRNQPMSNKPAPELSSYSALLNAILIVWRDLSSYTEVTYRGVTLGAEQFDRYTVGTEFAWINFVSSTNIKSVAERFVQEPAPLSSSSIKSMLKKLKLLSTSPDQSVSCIFIIDNSLNCKWSPKSIAEFSQFKNESEYLYPCGAQFRVTKVDKSESQMHIYLELICPIDSTPLRSLFEETKARAESGILTLESHLDEFQTDVEELRVAVDIALDHKSGMVELKTNSRFRLYWEKIEENIAIDLSGYFCKCCDTYCHEICDSQCFNDDFNRKVCNFSISSDHCTVCPGKCHHSQHAAKSLSAEYVQERANQDCSESLNCALIERDFNDLIKIITPLSSKLQEEKSELDSTLDSVNSRIYEFQTILQKSDAADQQQLNAIRSEQDFIKVMYESSATKYEETLNLCKLIIS